MSKSSAERSFRRALAALRRYGILLESDRKLPSITRIVAGKPIQGSWWAHPRGHEIHHVTQLMASHGDVLVTKLVSGKVTYVHRKLWPVIAVLGSARQDWQITGLSPAGKELLDLTQKAGRIRTDRIYLKRSSRGIRVGDAARELESRLLVHSQEVHTETGAHAKELETWKSWRRRISFAGRNVSLEDAKKRLEKVVADLDSQYGARSSLPWGRHRTLH